MIDAVSTAFVRARGPETPTARDSGPQLFQDGDMTIMARLAQWLLTSDYANVERMSMMHIAPARRILCLRRIYFGKYSVVNGSVKVQALASF